MAEFHWTVLIAKRCHIWFAAGLYLCSSYQSGVTQVLVNLNEIVDDGWQLQTYTRVAHINCTCWTGHYPSA